MRFRHYLELEDCTLVRTQESVKLHEFFQSEYEKTKNRCPEIQYKSQWVDSSLFIK